MVLFRIGVCPCVNKNLGRVGAVSIPTTLLIMLSTQATPAAASQLFPQHAPAASWAQAEVVATQLQLRGTKTRVAAQAQQGASPSGRRIFSPVDRLWCRRTGEGEENWK